MVPSAGGTTQNSSGVLGLALNAVDKVVGRRARNELENQVDQIAQSKWGIVVLRLLD